MSTEGTSMDTVITALMCQQPSWGFWPTPNQCQVAVIPATEEAETTHVQECSPVRTLTPRPV